MSDNSSRTLFVFTAVSSFWAVILGLIGPYYVLQVEKLSGGVDKLGIAFSIMILLQSAATYIAGRYSDRIGRKPFLIAAAFADAVLLFLYTVIEGRTQLYLLQAFLGITNGVTGTISTSLLGDLTVRNGRGKAVGRFNALVGLAAAAGVSASGFAVKRYGLTVLFYCASAAVALSAIALFFLTEPNRSEGA